MSTTKRPAAHAVLQMEEKAAWACYLEATGDQAPDRYREVEPWAWAQLGVKLAAIEARRHALEDEDGS